MKLNKLSIVVTALLGAMLVLPISASAQTVNQRLANQRAQIRQGVKTGALTSREARNARRSTRRIARRAAIDRARHGGHLTPGERVRLQNRLNHNSSKIYRLKHNGKVRPN